MGTIKLYDSIFSHQSTVGTDFHYENQQFASASLNTTLNSTELATPSVMRSGAQQPFENDIHVFMIMARDHDLYMKRSRAK